VHDFHIRIRPKDIEKSTQVRTSLFGKWTDIDLLYSLHTMALKYGRDSKSYMTDPGEHGQRLRDAGITAKNCDDKIRSSIKRACRNPSVRDEMFLSGFEKCIPAWRFWWSEDWQACDGDYYIKRRSKKTKEYPYTRTVIAPNGENKLEHIWCDFYG
jgi:hypothetical protein